MRKYEFLLLIKPNLDQEVENNFLAEFEKRLDGTIVKKEDWGLKKIAYPIKKELEAHYILYYMEIAPENILSARSWMNIKKELLRSMVIVHEKKWPFEMKTSKDVKFPERRQNTYNRDKFIKKNNAK